MPEPTTPAPTTTDPAPSPLKAIARLFRSSKFLVMLAAFIAATGAKFGWDIDNELIMVGLGLVAVLIGSIAHEDAAKHGSPTTIGNVQGNVTTTPEALPAIAPMVTADDYANRWKLILQRRHTAADVIAMTAEEVERALEARPAPTSLPGPPDRSNTGG